MEMHNEINIVFMPANTTSVLQPIDQGVTLTFTSYYLRNTFWKTLAAIDSTSSDGLGQSPLKTFWKVFTMLDAIKNIRDSWKQIKISALTRAWKRLTLTLMDDFEESRGGSNCRCGRNSKRPRMRSGA